MTTAINLVAATQQFQTGRGVTLTSHQERILDDLLLWCTEDGHGEQAVLSGYAGTGKTTLLERLVVALSARPVPSEWIWVTAPTHKATKVLADKLRAWEAYVEAPLPQPTTIHSALGLKPKKTRPGEPEQFVSANGPRIAPRSLLIVDECSMVGAELYRWITEVATTYQCRVLFTGDPKQLPPVNERSVSRTFLVPLKYELTEVLRHDGPVLGLATKVRSLHPAALPRITTVTGAESGVHTYPGIPELTASWKKALAQDSENTVLVCWTNKVRRQFNRQARQLLYGKDVPDFMEGDRLVMLKAWERGGQIVLVNNQDVTVQSVVQDTAELLQGRLKYDCWAVRLENLPGIVVPVLADHETARFKSDVTKLGKEIKTDNDKASAAYDFVLEQVQSGYKLSHKEAIKHELVKEAQRKVTGARRRWAEEYFKVKDYFAEVDFGYAVTIHKSQGSTYDRVFIHDDYTKARNERLQLLYVAITRAAKEVHHIEM